MECLPAALAIPKFNKGSECGVNVKQGGVRIFDFLADNLAIELNVIRAAHAAGVRKLLFLGSSCIYPKLAPQPMGENMHGSQGHAYAE
jgi:nucleoside-diphosphate-sugar epimerase